MAGIGESISWAKTFPLPLLRRGRGVGGWGSACRVSLILLISLIALAPISCSPSFNFQGQWSGKRNLPNNEKGENPILNTIAKVDLDLKPNGRFTLLEGGVPKEGAYRTAGRKAFLKVDTFMDRPIADQGELAVKMNQEIELAAQPDGSLSFNDPAGISKEVVTLQRVKQESQPPR